MLRITLPSSDGPGIVVLEGRLAGLWAQELLRVAREANHGPGTIFDLQEVFYVDSHGEEVLRTLSHVGATFATDTAYGKDLCKRLRLRRISGINTHLGEQDVEADAKAGEQIHDQPDLSKATFQSQQRSRCRE